jgi:hypothetical protein
MSESEALRSNLPSDYQQLPIDQKIACLQRALRQSCAAEPARTVSPEAARQSAAAESQI